MKLLCPTLLSRTHVDGQQIVHHDFPLPPISLPASLPPAAIDPEVVASTPPTTECGAQEQDPLDASENEPLENSQSSTKENDAPTNLAAARTSMPSFEVNDSPHPAPSHNGMLVETGTLPPNLLSLYHTTTRILKNDFAHSPPYTIQRLAELVLHPKRHYRFLPAYLRALDRIVSVSSPVSDFPLPIMSTNVNGGFLSNGDPGMLNGITEREGLGSDESLGGALLTPIPWLRGPGNSQQTGASSGGSSSQDGELHSESTETIEGPNGAGSVETVSVTVNGISSSAAANQQQSQSQQSNSNSTPASPTLSEQSDASSSSGSGESLEAQLRREGGVTQGELLRQEQEAGVVPISQASSGARRPLISGYADTASGVAGEVEMTGGEPEEIPHARGPEVIGMEDTGPQHKSLGAGEALDMEAAVGRARSPPSQQASLPSQVGSPLVTKAGQDVREHRPNAGPPRHMDEKMAADDPGRPGRDPNEVEKEVEKLKEVMDVELGTEAKDADGDIVVADVEGRPR